MKRSLLVFMVLVFPSFCLGATNEQTMFGPVKYAVKERFGKENRYQEKFKSPAGVALIKVQNGETLPERADVLEFTVNGTTLLRERPYEYRFLACFVKLNAENTFDLVLKDAKPTGFRRPTPTPKNVTITALPAREMLSSPVVLGLGSWEDLPAYIDSLKAIKSPEALGLAVKAAGLENDTAARGDALRQLADRKDPQALKLFIRMLGDHADDPDVRAEAALAIGYLKDKTAVPMIIRGLLDPQDQVRAGSARALSLYPEEDTREPLSKMFEGLDTLMGSAVARTIVNTGWKPVGTLLGIAESPDPVVANLGLELLIGVRDERAVERLLAYLEKPEHRDVRMVILALGETNSKRAADALLKFGGDADKRKGTEAELGVALVALGDQRAAETIADMARKADAPPLRQLLLAAYRKLTGRDLQPPPGQVPGK